MKHSHALITVSLVAAGLLCGTARTSAEEPANAFLHALQDSGYADVAVDFLRELQANPAKMPKKLADEWDLEMCRCLLLVAKQTFHPKEAEQLTQEAEKSLTKFLKEKPNHPEVAAAQVYWGQVLMERALQHLRVAQIASDAAQKTKELEAARKGLIEARQPFNEATKMLDARLAAMPKINLSKGSSREDREAAAERDHIETEWVNSVFQVALTDYYTGLTYLDPKDPEREKVFRRAIKRFDYIWQTHRMTASMDVDPRGLFAHMWHGRIVDEMGDKQTALDIYDEVLANAPDNPNQQTGMESLFSQVEHFRFLILCKVSPRDFLDEASAWLNNVNNRRRFRTTDGYQGVTLAIAKLLLEDPDKAGVSDHSKATSQALSMLKEMARVRSQHQQEAILLVRKYSDDTPVDVSQINNFDEATAVGDAAFGGHRWKESAAAYQRALELGEKSPAKDVKKRLPIVRDQLALTQLGVADDLVNQDKLDEALDVALKLTEDYAQKNRESAVGPKAAAAAVQLALGIYANAPTGQKAAKLEQLQKLTARLIEVWPQRPEADDARLALGQAQQLMGNNDKAMEVFESIKPNTERYPAGQFMAGRLNWLRYLSEKRAGKIPADQVATLRAKAVEQFQTAIDLMLKAKKADPDKPASKHLPEVQLFLAEANLEGNTPQKAIEILEPMLAEIQANKPERLDNNTLRIFLASVRSYVAQSNIDKANEVGTVLLTLGPDMPAVNGALVEFAQMVELEVKKADAELTKLVAAKKQEEAEKAKTQLESLKAMLGNLLTKLGERKELGIGGIMYVADTCLFLGLDKEAERQYKTILERYNSDEEFKKSAGKAITRVYAQSITVMRRKGDNIRKDVDALRDKQAEYKKTNRKDLIQQAEAKIKKLQSDALAAYGEARKAADLLVERYPNSLEPRMEKAHILQRIADQNPAAYDDAAADWSTLRTVLQGMRGKKPPAYYEVSYYLAICIARQGQILQATGQQADAEKKFRDAQKLLKSTLVVNAELDGPDRVAKYEILLKEITDLLPPAPEKPAAPATDAPPAATK
jgi:tetratricopeptide (TPR) repeat protein